LQMAMVVICAMICLKLPRESGNLANKFAAGAQISIGGQMGGMVADATSKAAIGTPLQKGDDGKHHLGGAAGLVAKGGKAALGSATEHSGAKGAANAAGKFVKGKAKAAGNKIKSAFKKK